MYDKFYCITDQPRSQELQPVHLLHKLTLSQELAQLFLFQHQAMKRHNEAWQDSLRYRRPDLDRMSGIRRITINANPMVGDEGAVALAEALKDDLWLKGEFSTRVFDSKMVSEVRGIYNCSRTVRLYLYDVRLQRADSFASISLAAMLKSSVFSYYTHPPPPSPLPHTHTR